MALRKVKSAVVLSSIPLQIVYYFNMFYYSFYFLATLLMVIYKSQAFSFPDGNLALDLILLILMVILEVIRLYLGSTHDVTGMTHHLFRLPRHSHHLELFAVCVNRIKTTFFIFKFYFCRGFLGKFLLCISDLRFI
ncbi:transmembrane protein 80-like isoform X2 [Mustelus asterias]